MKRLGIVIQKFIEAPIQIIDGDRGKNYPTDSEFSDDGYCLFLNTGNVTNSGFNFSNCQFISADKDQTLRKGKLKRNDLVMTTRGTVGNIGYYNNEIPFENIRINSGMVIFRTNQEAISSAYLYQYFRSTYFNRQVNSLRTGAAQPQLPIRDIKCIKIQIPQIGEQVKISNILSAYDDLIDTNRRRIQLLEESVRLLFREWFVYFKFPGHEKIKIVDGVPEGWGKEKINKLVSLLGGHAFKGTSYQQEGKYGIVTIKNVQQGSFIPGCTDYLEETPSGMRKHCFLSNGDILMSLTGNVGRVCLVYGENFLLNQRVAKIESKNKIPKSFIYWMFDNPIMQKRIENLSYGSAQQNLSPIKLGEQLVILPPNLLLERFDEIVSLINIEIIQFLSQNQKLAHARDLLLPRLMSGAIEV